MLYQVTREVISPFSQETLVELGEVLTVEAIMVLHDELGIDNIQCTIWMEWEPEQYPTEIRHLPVVNSEAIRFTVATDLAGLE